MIVSRVYVVQPAAKDSSISLLYLLALHCLGSFGPVREVYSSFVFRVRGVGR